MRKSPKLPNELCTQLGEAETFASAAKRLWRENKLAAASAVAVRFSAGFAGLSHIKNSPVSAAVTASAAALATLFLVPVIVSAFFSAPFLRVP